MSDYRPVYPDNDSYQEYERVYREKRMHALIETTVDADIRTLERKQAVAEARKFARRRFTVMGILAFVFCGGWGGLATPLPILGFIGLMISAAALITGVLLLLYWYAESTDFR